MKAIDKFLANWKKSATETYFELLAEMDKIDANEAAAKDAESVKAFSHKEGHFSRGNYDDDRFVISTTVASSHPAHATSYSEAAFEAAFPQYAAAWKAKRAFFNALPKAAVVILYDMRRLESQFERRAEIRKNFKEMGRPAPTFIRAKNYLDEVLTKEVESKRAKLIARVEKKTGKITDASALRIGANGELNGVVKGEKDIAEVNTITAGGYNIQCLHYRVLVK